MTKVFENYSKYYDLFYKDKDYLKETKFLLQVIKKYKLIGKDILSLGCGTATYEILLANKGFNIVGLDLSRKMLNIGHKKVDDLKLNNKIKLILQDVRKITLPKKFDTVMCMFNVIGYQNSNSDLELMLSGVSKHLKKGGLFLFDLWHAPAVIADKPQNRVREIEVDGRKIIRNTESKFHPTKDLIEIRFTVSEISSGKHKVRTREVHTMRYFSLPETSYFLKKAGLELVGGFNFPDIKSTISDDKWDIFIVAKKK